MDKSCDNTIRFKIYESQPPETHNKSVERNSENKKKDLALLLQFQNNEKLLS